MRMILIKSKKYRTFSKLTHAVALVRAFCFNRLEPALLLNLLYMIIFIAVFGAMAIKRLTLRVID